MSGARGPSRRVGGATVAGRRAVLESVRGGLAVEVLVARGSHGAPGLRELVDAAARANVTVREVDRAELDGLARDHRGVVARVRTREPVGERELAAWPFPSDAVVVVLDGIEDPQNLGAAARSAEAAGAAMLVIRTRRAADVTPAAIRASAGALAHLPCARVANIPRSLDRLKEAGFTVVGLDERAPLTVHDAEPPDGRVAVVVGSESGGLARLTRETCDLLVSLPMRGRVASLNASSALAAVLYSFVLRRPTVDDG
jgi:23S rRNA (guanosine2251-2'-O)-methyltransferase